MADTLSTINVDQLSNAVNAVVHAADSTQQIGNPRQVQNVTAAANQVTTSNVQVQVPVANLPIAGNTVTIGNNAVPIMLVRVAPTGHQLSNQLHTLPVAVNQITNQLQGVPVCRTVATGSGANVMTQLGNVALAVQPDGLSIAHPSSLQTITLPNINYPASTQSIGSNHANQRAMGTELLNLSGGQNITFGNILSVQQKPSSDILVLNPTNLQLDANNSVGNMASTALVAPTTLNTNLLPSSQSNQSPSINLNLNISLPTSSSPQTQTTAIPDKSVMPQPLGLKTTLQLPPHVMQQLLQPLMTSGSMAQPSSVVNIPVAGLLSPTSVIHPHTSASNITLQMAPVLQALSAVASSQAVSSQTVNISMPQPLMTQIAPQVTNPSVTQLAQNVAQGVPSHGMNLQPVHSQRSQASQPLPSQVAVPLTSQASHSLSYQTAASLTSQASQSLLSQVAVPMTSQIMQPSNLQITSNLSTHFSQTTTPQAKPGMTAQKEHVTTDSLLHAETVSSSQNQATASIGAETSSNQFAQDIASFTVWPPLQITDSSTTTTLTSTAPQLTTLQSTSGQDAQVPSSITSIPLHMTCENSNTAHGSLPVTSVTPHLTCILSDLTQSVTTSSDGTHGTHLAASHFHPIVSTQEQSNTIHLEPSDGTNAIMSDPVSAASMVAGVSADGIEGLDISIPPSLSALNVTAADFFHEIVTGIWCIDCKKYNLTTCAEHGPIVFIRDSLIETRAKQTLPKVLHLKPSKIAPKILGTFAVEKIQVRTQFGPLQGRIVSKEDKSVDVNSHLVWRIYSEGILCHYVDMTDERVSNWMMFVKLARTHMDQNVVAHQQGSLVYFTTIKEIESGDELYVWYCRDYTLWRGVPAKPEGTFACHLCPMQFTKLSQLKSHNKYSHANMSPRRWKCNMCVRAFTTQSKLNVHILVHMGVRPHKCEFCDKTFTDPSNLRQHRLIHTGVKKFVCAICSKSFRQKAHLESHLVIHTGEKKLKCKYCDQMFARSNDVTQHMYKHTKEKEVHCETCNRAFWRIGHLKKHQKHHTGEREFHCTQCGKSFVTSYHLKRHVQTCKGPRDRSKSMRRKLPRDSVESTSPSRVNQGDSTGTGKTGRISKSYRTSSSRGRPLRIKLPFTIEARPSRLRPEASSATNKLQRSPRRVVTQDTHSLKNNSSVSIVATSTISAQPQLDCDGTSNKGLRTGIPTKNIQT